MQLEASLSFQITACGNLLRQLTAQQIKSAGIDLTPEESVLLNQLWKNDDQPLSELARWAVKGPSTVTRQIDGLVKKGYVERVQGSEDRRQIFAKLTPAGKKIRAKFLKADVPNLDKCLPVMDDKDYAKTLQTIATIRQHLIGLLHGVSEKNGS